VTTRTSGTGRAAAAALALASLVACRPDASNDAPAATPLPTRQTTIDPVMKKLDAAQQEAERRRAEAERAGK
jgi:hypothetical protein